MTCFSKPPFFPPIIWGIHRSCGLTNCSSGATKATKAAGRKLGRSQEIALGTKNDTGREGPVTWMFFFFFRVGHWQVTFFFDKIFLINCQQSIKCDKRFLFFGGLGDMKRCIYIYIILYVYVFLRLQFWISQFRASSFSFHVVDGQRRSLPGLAMLRAHLFSMLDPIRFDSLPSLAKGRAIFLGNKYRYMIYLLKIFKGVKTIKRSNSLT